MIDRLSDRLVETLEGWNDSMEQVANQPREPFLFLVVFGPIPLIGIVAGLLHQSRPGTVYALACAALLGCMIYDAVTYEPPTKDELEEMADELHRH